MHRYLEESTPLEEIQVGERFVGSWLGNPRRLIIADAVAIGQRPEDFRFEKVRQIIHPIIDTMPNEFSRLDLDVSRIFPKDQLTHSLGGWFLVVADGDIVVTRHYWREVGVTVVLEVVDNVARKGRLLYPIDPPVDFEREVGRFYITNVNRVEYGNGPTRFPTLEEIRRAQG